MSACRRAPPRPRCPPTPPTELAGTHASCFEGGVACIRTDFTSRGLVLWWRAQRVLEDSALTVRTTWGAERAPRAPRGPKSCQINALKRVPTPLQACGEGGLLCVVETRSSPFIIPMECSRLAVPRHARAHGHTFCPPHHPGASQLMPVHSYPHWCVTETPGSPPHTRPTPPSLERPRTRNVFTGLNAP